MTVARDGAAVPRLSLRQFATWRGEVFGVATACALLATVTDVYLLDRKLGLFTGGYLAEYRVEGLSLPVFLAVSVLSDVAVLAPLIAAVLWVTRWFWMHAVARIFLAASVGLGVLAAADVAVYELHRYFGDIVNLGVLVDLVGSDIREILHFGVDPALHWLGLLSVGALAVLGMSVALDRWFPTQMRHDPGARRRTFVALVLVFVLALGVGAVGRLSDPAIDRGFRYKPTGRVLASVTQWLTDVDRDGYGLLSIPPDPAPFDASIHPYAIEIPGNGIDENGIGGDLPIGPEYRDPEYPPVTFTHRPDVVFVILESFRADAVGAVLDGKAVTPTLNRLKVEGVSAERAYSHNGFTIQSRYHAFTGKLIGPGDPGSLIDDFNHNGYETAFFSAQDESFGFDWDVGFERADVRYDARVDRDKRFTQFATPASLTVSWKVLEERVEAFLDQRSPDVPLFLHLNIQDGHFPYTNPDIVPLLNDVRLSRNELRVGRADDLRRMYLNTLANVDAVLGRMLARVEATTRRRPAVIVIADHGESLFDEGFLGHGYASNDAQTRIPFLVTGLRIRLHSPVGQLDVRPLLRQALINQSDDSPADGSGIVFQYIGTIGAPRAIAFVSRNGRRTVHLAGIGRPNQDEPADRQIVHWWERVQAAAARRGNIELHERK